MSKIAVLLADLFEDSEYTEPARSFKDAAHDLVLIGLMRSETVKVKKQGTFQSIPVSLFQYPLPYTQGPLHQKRDPLPFEGNL